VNESLKGIKDKEVEISAGRIDSSCYSGFTEGESYLVYAYGESEKSLSSGMCTRTTGLEDAAGELYYLHGLLKGVPEPRVYGSVIRTDKDLTKGAYRATPMNGIKIVVEGKDRKFEAVTNKLGLFNFSKVPDGEYIARVILPDRYRSYFPQEERFVLGSTEFDSPFHVHHGTTAYAGFRIGWNNSISGKIIDAEGNPITRAKVSVLILRKNSSLVDREGEAVRLDDGSYTFTGLTPGRYTISTTVRIPSGDANNPIRFFYPNADDVDQAQEIVIGENESLEGKDIRLPPRYLVRQIEGVLIWPNGVTVSRGWVCLTDSKEETESDNKYDCRVTDELGRFSLQAFVGAQYWVHGESNSSGKGEPVKLLVEKVNEPLKILIPFPKPSQP
jgi:hypothetical protein